ncbi:hypothetical protein [Slackia isoflavoniconvertens]|uniref:hypothetical protein n=1 Tax=Slackia isoflavoniconvertens TaxID=572010 RepID=UPI0030797B77
MEADLRFFHFLSCAAGGAERPAIGMGLRFLQKLFCILFIDIRHIGPYRCDKENARFAMGKSGRKRLIPRFR